MKRWIHTACLSVGLLALSLGNASAASTVFEMADHPDGEHAAFGAYGLRLDALGDSTPPAGHVSSALFSVEIGGADVDLTFDPANLAGGAILQGTIELTYNSGGALTNPKVFDLYYEMSNLAAAPNGGFIAQSGAGYIDFGGIFLLFDGKSDGESVFYFDADDHRLGGYGYDPNTWVARGWLTNFAACTTAVRDSSCQPISDVGFNDFLLTAPNGGDIPGVPEPSTMLLTMGGAALLWLRKRRS